MSDHKTFTTAYAIPKESWIHFSVNDGFREHIEDHLGRHIAERIFIECQRGEKIVTVGKPYTHELETLNQIETRADVRIEELIRCKNCKHSDKDENGLLYCTGTLQQIGSDDYCSFAERRSE